MHNITRRLTAAIVAVNAGALNVGAVLWLFTPPAHQKVDLQARHDRSAACDTIQR
jgi:hypothetical protein